MRTTGFCILYDYNLAVELTFYRAIRNVNPGSASYIGERFNGTPYAYFIRPGYYDNTQAFAYIGGHRALDFANGANKFNRHIELPHFAPHT